MIPKIAELLRSVLLRAQTAVHNSSLPCCRYLTDSLALDRCNLFSAYHAAQMLGVGVIQHAGHLLGHKLSKIDVL